jgi:hypothetical protein
MTQVCAAHVISSVGQRRPLISSVRCHTLVFFIRYTVKHFINMTNYELFDRKIAHLTAVTGVLKIVMCQPQPPNDLDFHIKSKELTLNCQKIFDDLINDINLPLTLMPRLRKADQALQVVKENLSIQYQKSNVPGTEATELTAENFPKLTEAIISQLRSRGIHNLVLLKANTEQEVIQLCSLKVGQLAKLKKEMQAHDISFLALVAFSAVW